MLLPESLLNWMELTVLLQSFNCGDLTPIRLDRKKSAGLDRLTVEMNRASTAVTGIAPDMSPGQAEDIAYAMNKQKTWLDIGFITNIMISLVVLMVALNVRLIRSYD